MFRASWVTVAVVAVFLVFPAASLATTWTVNTTADNTSTAGECSGAAGDCSIRQAANKAVSGDTISIPANANPYLVDVANGFIAIPGGVTVVGAGVSQTTISGQGTGQIFEVDTAGTTTFEGLTLANADNATGNDEAGAITANQGGSPNVVVDGVVFSDDVSGEWGGAIEQNGTGNLTVSDSSFVNDTATQEGGGAIDYYGSGSLTVSNSVFTGDADFKGGAIVIESEPAASTISDSTFSGDSATGAAGGAIDTETSSGVAVYNSTLTGNTATTDGGGIAVESGANATLVNDTVTSNTAPTGANLDGSGTLSLQNTIISNPRGGGANCAGTVTSNGNNLEDTSPSSCGLSAASSDLIGVGPQLASTLAVNGSTVPTAGGPPQTLALSSTSPAFGAASTTGCATVGGVDERGFPRPYPGDARCDIGAFELQLPTPPPPSSAPTSVLTSVPSVTSPTGAAFSGSVNPQGLPTTAYFEYGLDARYSTPGASGPTYTQTTPPQVVGSDFSIHTVTASVTGLVPNAIYHVRLVATNSAGTTYGADQTFLTKHGPPPAPPVLGKSFDAKPVSGLVLIRLPGTDAADAAHLSGLTKGQGFIPLTEARQLPSGTEVDAQRGAIQLQSAAPQPHKIQTGTFTGGIYGLSQDRAGVHKGLTTLHLLEGLFPGAPTYASCKAHAATDQAGAQAAGLSSAILQTLRAKAHGRFRTRGRYAAATVRGTAWTISDRCNGTLVVVQRDTVDVIDFVRHITVLLHAHHSYLARAPRRR